MEVISAILPVVLVILTGYVATRSGYIRAETLRPMGDLVLRVALPALIFLAVGVAGPGGSLRPALLVAMGLASLGSFACGTAIGLWALRLPRPQAVLVGLGFSASNSGFLGYPIVQNILGGSDAAYLLAHTMVIENLLVIPLALILSTTGTKDSGTALRPFLQGLLGNPLIIALVLGLLLRLTGLTLPTAAMTAMDMLARVSGPVALLVVGGTLATMQTGDRMGSALVIAMGKLILHPLLSFAAVLFVADLPPSIAAGMVIFAAMPMISIFPILSGKVGLQSIATSALLVTTLMGGATVILWILAVSRWSSPF